MLAVLTRDQMAHAMFPLGDTTKTQVREEARQRGLAVADKPDSHDICFIADGNTRTLPSSSIPMAPYTPSWPPGRRRPAHTLTEPTRGVAAGQPAVLYDADTVLGSATITTQAAIPVYGRRAVVPCFVGCYWASYSQIYG